MLYYNKKNYDMNTVVDPGTLMKLSKALKGDAILTYAVVKIYDSDKGSDWEYTGNCGVLCLVSEKNTDVLYFKLFDMEKEEIVWNHELYLHFPLNTQCPHFASFESNMGHIIGLLFAEGQNINQFQQSLVVNVSSYSNAKKSVSSTPPTTKEDLKEQKGIFGWIKQKITGTTETKPPKRVGVRISKAEGFTRVTHIGYDPEKGFVYENLPQEWREMFAASGIDKSVLEDPKTAQLLVKEMKKFERKLDETRRPPPPPPTAKANVSLPPPPPLPTSVSAAESNKLVSMPPPPPPPGLPPPPNFLVAKKEVRLSEKPALPDVPLPQQDKTPLVSKSGSDRNDLLEQIRTGNHKAMLKAVRPQSVNIDLNDINEEEKKDLASALQRAMLKIRKDIEDSDDEDENWDD